jgi:acyl carrier protein
MAMLSDRSAYEVLRTALSQVAPEADLTTVGPHESLREAFDLDSLDFLTVVEKVATATGVSVPDGEYHTVDSIDGFVHYIEQRAGTGKQSRAD